MSMATQVQMGSGLGDAASRDSIWRGWQKAAQGPSRQVAKKATPAEMRAMGIGVRRVAKKAAASVAKE